MVLGPEANVILSTSEQIVAEAYPSEMPALPPAARREGEFTYYRFAVDFQLDAVGFRSRAAEKDGVGAGFREFRAPSHPL